MTKIKICGLTRRCDIETVNMLLPDYIGFVFAKSKRQVTMEEAKSLKELLNLKIKAVGVFVNENPEHIKTLCRENIIDIVQLHGDESEEYIMQLKDEIPNSIIKAVRVKGFEDIKRAENITCDYLLLDTYHEKQYGGSGIPFDWSMISNINKPYFLAGGINVTNILEAKELGNPYCIDLSSGVETDGWKDPVKINEIIMILRG